MVKFFGRHGRRKQKVPNLFGLTREQARVAIENSGFNYSESQEETNTSELNNLISSQSFSADSVFPLGTTVPFVYYNYVPPITYGPCEAYGDATNIGSGTQCSGTYYQNYTDYRYNTRKKIYVGGVWDGSSYTTAGCGTTDVRSVTSSSQVDGLCGYSNPVTITYGDCEAYGSGTEIDSGNQCSGTTYQSYTDYRYNTRKKIYVNGSWDGSSYTTSGCGTADIRSITGGSQIDGLCGYTNPVTYGPCEAYGNALYEISSGTQCSGTYYQVWTDYAYSSRKKIYVYGSWDGSSYTTSGCGTVSIRSIVSSAQYDGYCGYSAPPPAVTYYCTESFNGAGVGNCTYTTSSTNTSYSNTSYSSRSCSTSGYPSCLSTNPAPVCTSYKYQCKSYDVTNSASTNYYDCYSVGACTAPRNPDGSRAQCCASYA